MGAFQSRRNKSIRNQAVELKQRKPNQSQHNLEIRRYEQSVYTSAFSSTSRIMSKPFCSENYPHHFNVLSTLREGGVWEDDFGNDQYFNNADILGYHSKFDDVKLNDAVATIPNRPRKNKWNWVPKWMQSSTDLAISVDDNNNKSTPPGSTISNKKLEGNEATADLEEGQLELLKSNKKYEISHEEMENCPICSSVWTNHDDMPF